MINSNDSYNIQKDVSTINQYFKKLNPSERKLLIQKLSSEERLALFNIIQQNNDLATISKEMGSVLIRHIQHAKDLSPDITRKDDTKSKLTKLTRILSEQRDNLAYFFNILTADKANAIFQSLVQEECEIVNDPKPQISNIELKELLEKAKKEAEPGTKITLAKLLSEKGFSREMTGIQFTDSLSLKDVNLTGIIFNNCSFDWTPCSNSILKDVAFRNCDISNVSFMNSNFENCEFINCDMRETMFTGAELKNVFFIRCGIISSSFEDTTISEGGFYFVSMPATHFLEASINNCEIAESSLKDTVFFDNLDKFIIDNSSKKTAIMTKATAAILIHPEARGITTPKAYMKLDQTAHLLPLRITMQAQKATKEGVNKEVEAALQEIDPNDPNKIPIAQSLIQKLAVDTNSESARILRKAEKLASQVDSFFLPGGEDVPPALYGQKKGDQTDWGDDYRRSILELGMIHQSFNKGIPLMAVCRGFQMSNVYCGAQLIQHVDGHKGIQTLKLTYPEKQGLYADAMKKSIVTACFHHQAVPQETAAREHLQLYHV